MKKSDHPINRAFLGRLLKWPALHLMCHWRSSWKDSSPITLNIQIQKPMSRQKAPGKYYRKGMSLVDVIKLFPTDKAAEKWLIEQRWPEGVDCPHCHSKRIHHNAKHRTMPMRCRDCRKWFSVRSGTAMQGSKLGYQKWILAFYLMATGIKGVSSMKLHRDLGITQKSAWFLAHRIRECWDTDKEKFSGPVEADETYFGGKRKNMPKYKREKLIGRGPVGKTYR